MMTAPGSMAEALAALQAQLPHVGKNQRAKVEKDGRTVYSYDYADLADINAALLPVMAALGLSFTACPTAGPAGGFFLAYSLLHASGDKVGGEYPLPDPARYGPQDLGKAITYARRYALCAVTGLSPGGDDSDAQEVQHGKKTRAVPDAQLAAEGRMTRGQAREHDQLAADTRRQPRRAERVRPSRPDPDSDPWATDEPVNGHRAAAMREILPERAPGSMQPGQHRAIEMLLGKLGVPRDDRIARHAMACTVLGLDELPAGKTGEPTLNGLSYEQAAAVITGLSDMLTDKTPA